MKTAILTNIQRGSLHDGPGVRITFFFEGCNLKCEWCHNPESRPLSPTIMHYPEKCISCGLCKKTCKNEGNCIFCGECTAACPTGARVMSAKEYTTQQMLKFALRESAFFGKDGGVTCSGGEPLLQIDALQEFLMLCKKHNLHTAVDTALNVPWKNIEKILPFTDLFLADYKLSNEEQHIRYTGVSRKLILENLEKLSKSNCRVILRMPIIHGIHDNENQIDTAGKELIQMGFKGEIELLPFHRLGCSKYIALGQEYSFANTVPPSNETIQMLADRLSSFGLNVKKGVKK